MGDSGIILIDMYEVAIRKPRIMLSLISAVKTIFTLGELLIVSRFILDFLHAAPSIFVIWVEALTNPLLRPFVGTFPPVKVGGTFVVEFYDSLEPKAISDMKKEILAGEWKTESYGTIISGTNNFSMWDRLLRRR